MNGRPRIAYVFSGYGAQWWGMGRGLLERESVFRSALAECDGLLQQHGLTSVLRELQAPESESRLGGDRLDITQPALFAIQVALAALWRSWGIAPDLVVGHSMGETAAAYVSGLLSLADAARVCAERARVMYDGLLRYPGRGAMAAVELSVDDAHELLRDSPDLSLAAHNGPTSLVLSGEAPALEHVLATLRTRGVFCRTLQAPGAGHSPVVEEARTALVAALAGLSPQTMRVPMISTVTGQIAAPEDYDAAYWGHNMRDTVRFADAMDRLLEQNVDVFLEIGPHPVLSPSIAECLRNRGRAARILPSIRRNEAERATMLGSVGALYTAGASVDWQTLYPSGRRVTVPSYPWQRERFWLEQDDDGESPGRHPFLGHALASAQPSGEYFWQTRVRLNEIAFLRDHKVGGRPLLPGTAYVEMIVAAAAEFFGRSPDTLRHIHFHKAAFFDEPDRRSVQIVLSPGANDEATVRVYSRVADESWTLHASAQAGVGAAEAPAVDGLAAIQSRCATMIASADYYDAFRQRGLDYGPLFQGLGEVWQGSGEALGRVTAPDRLERELALYHVHPALLDACLQTLGATVTLESSNGGGIAALPVAIDEIRLHRRLVPGLWSHARALPVGAAETRTLAGNVNIFDDEGALVAEVRGFKVRYLDTVAASSTESWNDWLYSLQWPVVDVRADAAPAPRAAPIWLVLADSAGVGESLVDLLRARGCVTYVASPGTRYSRSDDGMFTLRPGEIADLDGCLDAIAAPDPLNVVHAWSLDVPPPGGTGDWARSQALGPVTAVQLVQALHARERAGGAPRLWLVTAGSQPVGVAPVSAIEQAPLWGLGRAIAQEHHSIWGGLVDLDPEASSEENAAHLLRGIEAADREDQIAWRSGHRHVARLAHERPPAIKGRPPLLWRADGSYLITGGFGALGLAVARWMVNRGARRVILLGRTPLPPRAGWHALLPASPQGRTVGAIRDLESLGATIHPAFVDVADEFQLAAFLTTFQEEGWPPIRGVVHAAGVARLDALAGMSHDALLDVLRPKVRGAWVLHDVLERVGAPLDFFVVFSSFSALLGSPGLAHYAAANSFLDALAHYRRGRGRPALTVNWGAWGEVGMAARFLESGRTPLPGVESFAPEQALAALDHLLRHGGVTQIGLTRVDWTRWRDLYPSYMNAPFLNDVGHRPTAPGGDQAGADERVIRATVLAAPAGEREALVESYLRTEVAGVLRTAAAKVDVERPFNTLGIDSLTAVELKNRIETDLRVSVQVVGFLQGLTVRELAHDLVAQLAAAPAPAPVEGGDAATALSAIDQLSDDEVDKLLGELQAEEQA